MNHYLLPILAAFGCAIGNGTAAILQKVSADKEKTVGSMDARLLWRLFQDKPYIGGVALDLVGWGLTLYAVQYLPLFLVESIIATNMVVTALIERLVWHRVLSYRVYLAIGIIVIGIIPLLFAATPEKAAHISNLLRWLIVFSPLPIAAAGYFLARRTGQVAAIGLAVLGGLAFGGTSVVGRIFVFSQPLWHTIYSPLVLALIANGILGILLFSIALQRSHATVVNATMTSSQTLIPALVGIVFLGDSARNGMWYLVAIGTGLSICGFILLALSHDSDNLMVIP
jgi:drug/metabolite transporter (DMT)-like permease